MKILLSIALIFVVSIGAVRKYAPSWDSLDSRPLPKWYDEAKIGIFLHWGVFSVPAFQEWFWYNWANKNPEVTEYMRKYYPPDFTYADFAPQFRAQLYNTDELADIFHSAGAKLILICYMLKVHSYVL